MTQSRYYGAYIFNDEAGRTQVSGPDGKPVPLGIETVDLKVTAESIDATFTVKFVHLGRPPSQAGS